MLLAILLILLVLLVAFSAIQTLYLESMRLRTRDLPALHFFKSDIEDSLGMRPELAALSFSVWKHACLVSVGIVTLLRAMEGRVPEIWAIVEALLVSWAGMVICAYAVPQVLYRRTCGHWLRPMVPFYKITALAIRPLVALLSFGHSLLEIVNPEPEESEPATAAENIEALIAAGEEEGLIEEDDRKLIQSVVEFGDKTVREVMTARPNIVAIPGDRTLEELHALVVTEQYSRIPVYRNSIDDIAGFVHVRDMFEVAESSRRRSERSLTRRP